MQEQRSYNILLRHTSDPPLPAIELIKNIEMTNVMVSAWCIISKVIYKKYTQEMVLLIRWIKFWGQVGVSEYKSV